MSASEGILKARAGECNFITDENNHVFSIQKMFASSGGLVRGWKHLAREKVALEQLVLLFQLRGVSRKIWRFWRIWFPQRDDVLALKASKQWRLVSSPVEANELLERSKEAENPECQL